MKKSCPSSAVSSSVSRTSEMCGKNREPKREGENDDGTRLSWAVSRSGDPGQPLRWVSQELDSRFRGNDIALKLFAVMPALRLRSGQAPAGIQDLPLLRVKQPKSALIRWQPKATAMGY